MPTTRQTLVHNRKVLRALMLTVDEARGWIVTDLQSNMPPDLNVDDDLYGIEELFDGAKSETLAGGLFFVHDETGAERTKAWRKAIRKLVGGYRGLTRNAAQGFPFTYPFMAKGSRESGRGRTAPRR